MTHKPSKNSFQRHHVRALTGAVLGIWIWYGGARGNDTSGIIPWSPGIDSAARQIAASHCGAYNKYAVITSIRPWYGDYIGFVCRRPMRWGPALH